MIKPIFFHSHDWHVQPDCQRSTSVYRLSGPLWIAKRSLAAVLELVASQFSTHFLRLPEIESPVKPDSGILPRNVPGKLIPAPLRTQTRALRRQTQKDQASSALLSKPAIRPHKKA